MERQRFMSGKSLLKGINYEDICGSFDLPANPRLNLQNPFMRSAVRDIFQVTRIKSVLIFRSIRPAFHLDFS